MAEFLKNYFATVFLGIERYRTKKLRISTEEKRSIRRAGEEYKDGENEREKEGERRGGGAVAKKRTHAFTRHSQQLHRQNNHHHSNAVIVLPLLAL